MPEGDPKRRSAPEIIHSQAVPGQVWPRPNAETTPAVQMFRRGRQPDSGEATPPRAPWKVSLSLVSARGESYGIFETPTLRIPLDNLQAKVIVVLANAQDNLTAAEIAKRLGGNVTADQVGMTIAKINPLVDPTGEHSLIFSSGKTRLERYGGRGRRVHGIAFGTKLSVLG